MESLQDVSFILIGPGKTGTTWLSTCLREHPEIYCSPENNHLAHGPEDDWEAWREYYRAYSGEPLVGDYSPWYATYPNVPEQLAELNPDLKLILTVRDPVKRCISAYKHDLRYGTIGRHVDLDRAIGRDLLYERYIAPGMYHDILQRLLEYFPREQIFLFDSPDTPREDLEADFTELLTFLGAQPSSVPSLTRQVNKSRTPLSPLLEWYASYGHRRPLRWLARGLRPFNRKAGQLLVDVDISDDAIAAVREIYRDCGVIEGLAELEAKGGFPSVARYGSWGLA